jgi:hypothetical protein
MPADLGDAEVEAAEAAISATSTAALEPDSIPPVPEVEAPPAAPPVPAVEPVAGLEAPPVPEAEPVPAPQPGSADGATAAAETAR